MSPSISVVIPCYNVETLIREAVSCALVQTHRPVEIICVDDGSTDGTPGVLEDLAAESPDLVRVITKTNGGAPSARNAGLHQAQGEWIQFLDADDVIERRKLEHQASLIESSQERADLVAGAHHIAHIDGRMGSGIVEEEDPLVGVVLHCLGVTSANLFRRQAVIDAGGWNESMPCSQEYELMYRMARNHARVLFDHEPLTTLRERPGSVGKHSDALQVNIRLRGEVVREYLRRDDWNPEDRQRMLDSIFGWLRMSVNTRLDDVLDLYHEVMPRDFRPRPMDRTTRAYTLAFRFLGFERTERLRQKLGRMRQPTRSEPKPGMPL